MKTAQSPVLLFLLLFLSLETAQGVAAQPRQEPSATADSESTLPSAELTAGFLTGEWETEGIGDLLIPVWNPGGTGLLFVNPRSAFTDHDGEEVNLGVGYRQLLPGPNIILGANAYYDYRDTGHSTYDQWGVGIEMLSPWIDARANYYDPDDKKMVVGSYTESQTSQSVSETAGWMEPYAEDHTILQDYTVTRKVTTVTDTHTYEQYEQALGGYDWEIGLRLPLPIQPEAMEARLFGGMYDFDRDFGDDAEGWKARAEIRILSTLFLDGGVYENDELTGSDWFAGARFTVPFDLTKVSQGRNPFSTAESRLHGRTRTLQSRLSEMVMRDPQIRLEQSKFMENKALETEDTSSSQTTEHIPLLLMSDIQFVDQDSTLPGDGTAEQPYATIQSGVDNAFGQLNVYVHDAASAYEENVVLTDGIQLYGSGYLIEGMGGRFFGSGIAPIIDGMSQGPTITLADQTRVSGFTVRNTDIRGTPIFKPSGELNIMRTGIFGDRVRDILLTHNVLTGNSVGALVILENDHGNAQLIFTDSLVHNNDLHGIKVRDGNEILIQNSSFNQNGWIGLFLFGNNARIRILDCQANQNAESGIHVIQSYTDEAVLEIHGVEANNNSDAGLRIKQHQNETSLATLSAISANNNGTGIVFQQGASGTSLAFIGQPGNPVTANNNNGDGLKLISAGSPEGETSEPLFTLFNVSTCNNGGSGLILTCSAYNDIYVTGERIVSTGNSADGIRAYMGRYAALDIGGGPFGSLGFNSIHGNGGYDISTYVGGMGDIWAENNWWGTATPTAGQFSGTVDYIPWLVTPPSP